MILFLDFDGVLHPAVCYDDENLMCRLSLFEEVMRDFPDVEIVISSTWREGRTLQQLQAFFSPDIGSRIVGVTPRWQDIQDEFAWGTYVRQAEIEHWLKHKECTWESWVALDDTAYLFRPFLPNLVKSSPAEGITAEICMSLREKLRRD